jgi:hypothetical protein
LLNVLGRPHPRVTRTMCWTPQVQKMGRGYLQMYQGNCSVDVIRWYRGSALPLSTQVRGSKPGQSRQDFQGRKILSAPSFGGEVKLSVPCRRFTACKRSLNVVWKSTFRQNYRLIFWPTSSTFRCLDLSRRVDVETPGGESGNV